MIFLQRFLKSPQCPPEAMPHRPSCRPTPHGPSCRRKQRAASAGGAEEGSLGQVRSTPPLESVQLNYARTESARRDSPDVTLVVFNPARLQYLEILFLETLPPVMLFLIEDIPLDLL